MLMDKDIRRAYNRNHQRIYAAFGKASQYQCLLCFDTAAEWAWLWRTHPDPADPNSYMPMCRTDHLDYDHPGRWLPRKDRTNERYESNQPAPYGRILLDSSDEPVTEEMQAWAAAVMERARKRRMSS